MVTVAGGGYPRIKLNSRTCAAHIVSFVNAHGYVPGNKQIDHKCRNRMCVNPDHLEMVSHIENQKRRDRAAGRPRKRRRRTQAMIDRRDVIYEVMKSFGAEKLVNTVALSAPLPRAIVQSPVEAFGNAELSLRERTLRRLGVSLSDLTGRAQRGPAGAARKEVAFLLWTQCPHLSLADVAKLIGRADHSAAIHCILGGARARGLQVARVSDLREGNGDLIDWTKLAYQAAGYRSAQGSTLDQAARRAGVTRTEWRKVEHGRAVSAGTMLRICRLLAVDPLVLLPHADDPASGRAAPAPGVEPTVSTRPETDPSDGLAAYLPVTRETAVKHEVGE